MGIFQNIFSKVKLVSKTSRFKELGTYQSTFSGFGGDIYNSEIVRSSIRALAEHTSKANIKSTDPMIERILNTQPNKYMNCKAFLFKVRALYELMNTAFVYIERDDIGRPISYYPIPYQRFQAEEYGNRLYIRFYFVSAQETVLPWDDLVVMRKDFCKSDIAGDSNIVILQSLELMNTANQGIANAIRATANLRGILKSTKAMLDPEDIKQQQQQFVKDYLNLENEGGIAALDASQEFIPITMNPIIASYKHTEEMRLNIFRYYGTNDDILMNKFDEASMEAFYEGAIEPFLIDFGMELTNKSFSPRQVSFGKMIMLESNRLQFASNQTKLAMVSLVDRGALTPNEWREIFNLSPVPGGDVPLRRLDTAQVDVTAAQEDNANLEGDQNGSTG